VIEPGGVSLDAVDANADAVDANAATVIYPHRGHHQAIEVIEYY